MSEKIIIEIGGLTLMEPMAVVWNWLISLLCMVAYIKLGRLTTPAIKEWCLFFLLFGLSTFFGGIGHGLYRYFGDDGKILPWTLGIIAVFFAERGIYSFISDERKKLKTALHFFSLTKMLLALAGMAFVAFSFGWAKNNSIIGLVLLVGFGGYLLSRKDPELIYLPVGVLVLCSAAFVDAFDINPHTWFNRDDLAHLIIIFGLLFFYIAIRKHQLALDKECENDQSEIDETYSGSLLP